MSTYLRFFQFRCDYCCAVPRCVRAFRLSVTGGIPRYLEEIDPSETAAENIRRLCFSPKGVLREDFVEMFADVITKAPMLASRVLRSLVDGPKSVSEIAAALGTARGGAFPTFWRS